MKKIIVTVILTLSLILSYNAKQCYAKSKLYTKDNIKLLSKIIHHEAGNVRQKTRKLVGVVVLKRMKSPLFPNTMRGVLFQPRQYMSEYSLMQVTPNKKSIKTAKNLLKKGYKGIKKYPDNLLFHSNFVQGEIYAVSDGVYFCLHNA